MSSMMISLSKDEKLTDWMRRELKKTIQGRYRIINFAEDHDLCLSQMYRFMRSDSVNQEFINQLFAIVYDIHSDSQPAV